MPLPPFTCLGDGRESTKSGKSNLDKNSLLRTDDPTSKDKTTCNLGAKGIVHQDDILVLDKR